MKKIFLITVMLLVICAPAFAAIGVDSTGTLSVGGTDTTDTLTCGLSSQVHAIYDTDGVAGTPAQWFVIGTYHVGGTQVYATAQDITNIWHQDKIPGKAFVWSGLPEDSAASNEWSGDVWEQL